MPPTRDGSARLVLLSNLPEAGTPGPRIRVVGRVVGRDVVNSYILLEDEDVGVSVDLGSAIGEDDAYLPSLKDLVMVTGMLSTSDNIVVPVVEASHSSPSIAETHVLRAILIKPCEELDIEDWRKAVRAVDS